MIIELSTEFKLYNIDEEKLYKNLSQDKKEALRPQIVEMAKKRGIKPTARYFNTYPSTIRNIIRKMEKKNPKDD